MDTIANNKGEERVYLKKANRWCIYLIFCILNSAILISLGVISSGISSIKSLLHISDQEFGLFGTIVGLGGIIGSFAFISLINVLNRKYFLLSALVLHSLGLVLFCYLTQFYLLLAIRAFNGMLLLICIIYFPLWIDQFGFQKYKSWMMTCLFLSSSLGMLWGYLINLIFGGEQWQKGFFIEAGITLVFCFILAMFPEGYFSKRVTKRGNSKVNTEENLINTAEDVKQDSEHDNRLESIFITQHLSVIRLEESSTQSPPSKNSKNSILRNPMLMLISFTKAAQNFNSTSVNYWYSDYLATSLHVSDANTIFYSFSFVVILGPLLGVFIGGGISSFIGGYESKNALLVVLVLTVLSCPFAVLTPFVNSVELFSIILFCYKLCDNATNTLSSGLVLISVTKELKGKANGLMNFICNLFAFLPAPYVYAFIKNRFSHISNKSGMYFACYQGLTAAILMLIAFIISKSSKDKDKQGKCYFEKSTTKEVLLKDIKVNTKYACHL